MGKLFNVLNNVKKIAYLCYLNNVIFTFILNLCIVVKPVILNIMRLHKAYVLYALIIAKYAKGLQIIVVNVQRLIINSK